MLLLLGERNKGGILLILFSKKKIRKWKRVSGIFFCITLHTLSKKLPCTISLPLVQQQQQQHFAHTILSSILPSSFSTLYTLSLGGKRGRMGEVEWVEKALRMIKNTFFHPFAKWHTHHRHKLNIKCGMGWNFLSLSSPIPLCRHLISPPDFLSLTLLLIFKTETTFSNITTTTLFHLFSFNCSAVWSAYEWVREMILDAVEWWWGGGVFGNSSHSVLLFFFFAFC